MSAIGIDPGVRYTGLAYVARGRWVASARLRGANGAASDWSLLVRTAARLAAEASAWVLAREPDVVAIESMGDQGPVRQAWRHRHTTAACCQALWDAAVAGGWHGLVVWQLADVVLRHGGRGYGDLAYLLQMGRAGLGAPAPLDEHQASAMAHALWAEQTRASRLAGG